MRISKDLSPRNFTRNKFTCNAFNSVNSIYKLNLYRKKFFTLQCRFCNVTFTCRNISPYQCGNQSIRHSEKRCRELCENRASSNTTIKFQRRKIPVLYGSRVIVSNLVPGQNVTDHVDCVVTARTWSSRSKVDEC